MSEAEACLLGGRQEGKMGRVESFGKHEPHRSDGKLRGGTEEGKNAREKKNSMKKTISLQSSIYVLSHSIDLHFMNTADRRDDVVHGQRSEFSRQFGRVLRECTGRGFGTSRRSGAGENSVAARLAPVRLASGSVLLFLVPVVTLSANQMIVSELVGKAAWLRGYFFLSIAS